MAQTNWDADKMMDVYIYDYLVKRNFQASAKAFQAEAKVSDPVAIDAPGGFLFEWWSVFWDIFVARTSEKHSEIAASYIETQLVKAREHQHQLSQQQQQLQVQQILLQKQAQQQQQQHQQQRRDGSHILNGSTNGCISSDPLTRQNPGTASAIATKMYEEGLKLPTRDTSDDSSIKRFGESAGRNLDPNHPPMLKSAISAGQTPGQVLHGSVGGLTGTVSQSLGRNQQPSGPTQDNKSEVNPMLNHRTNNADSSLIGVPGSNSGGNQLTLKGWPLTGLDQLRSGILQQKSFLQSPQPFPHLPILTQQQQQQLMLQAQLNMASQSAGDLDNRRLKMYLTNRNMMLGKDCHVNSSGDALPNVGSSMQSACHALPRGDTEMLIKRMAQLQQQQQQQQQQNNSQQLQFQQHTLSSQQSQVSNPQLHQQEKMAASSVTVEGSMSNNLRGGNDQATKSIGRKRKQAVSSSGPANSSGTANTTGPSPSSGPSTPSTHTHGDAISIPSLQHNGNPSKPLIMFGSDGSGTLTSPSNQLWDEKGEILGEDGSLEENVESFFSHDDGDLRENVNRCADANKGFTFNEIGHIRASTSKVICCHFSSDGKLLATGGHDKKAVLWSTDTLKLKATLEEHTMLITDVRFSPSTSCLATSSFDKTVRVWDADNPSYTLRSFSGHSTAVMSVDFHPSKDDLICSCDGDGEVRYWSINNGTCPVIFKGGTIQVRFQPRLGRYLAAAAESVVSVLDIETQACLHSLQGHAKLVNSICWDPSGEYLASVSEDSVKVWSLRAGSEGECVHELTSSGNKFHSCVFHPTCSSLLAIGCFQSLELWNIAENKTMALPAHDGLIATLAASKASGLVASGSHDKFVKLWK